MLLSSVGQDQSVFASASPQSAEIARLFTGILIVSAVIFLLVTILVVIACVRFRTKGEPEHPPQYHGNVRTEIAWTVAPFLLLVAIFVFTVRVMRSAAPGDQPASTPGDIVIIGHQWWWEARYPASGVITANEIHIPAGTRWLARIEATDVIHDFWVPALGPKIDAVPGYPNFLWIEADSPGTYLGTCAEYCGNQHAWMRIRVVADTADEFARWQDAQNRPIAEGIDSPGYRLFRDHTCVNCHALKGTDAKANVGPDLTHLASRATLGAGVLVNNRENLYRWMQDTQGVKPGIHMPTFRMPDSDLAALTDFLESLQ